MCSLADTTITEILHHHRNRLRYGGVGINRYWSKASAPISHSLKDSQPSSDVKRVYVRHKPTLPPPAFWLPDVSDRLAIAREVRATGQQSELSREQSATTGLKSREATGAGLTVRAFLQHKTGRVCIAGIEWGF